MAWTCCHPSADATSMRIPLVPAGAQGNGRSSSGGAAPQGESTAAHKTQKKPKEEPRKLTPPPQSPHTGAQPEFRLS
ncbi:hypothetical protein FQN60_010517 [Etheostoma spectabile]|uniref:Uncharacterized protein n=1 Tax=Etheostoma spectabile TaxID=54343 RepID=A0A5J5D379_9PERO|nr:hypothetical protein FQN60_010517 [Etheostoma spectabile]